MTETAEKRAIGQIEKDFNVAFELFAHERLDALGRDVAAFGVIAQDVVEPDPGAGQARRQVENIAELPVPADQPQVLGEHGDALAHMIERCLQDLAVVLQRRIGVVEQLECCLGGDRALAQHQ